MDLMNPCFSNLETSYLPFLQILNNIRLALNGKKNAKGTFYIYPLFFTIVPLNTGHFITVNSL